MPLLDNDKIFTYSDYLDFPQGERWEIIDGVPCMQAAPSWKHQAISAELLRQFANYLIDKTCKAFSSPFDLILPVESKDIKDSKNIMQPDLLIVCDLSKLKGTGLHGVPDLVVEITSPSTIRNDKVLKFNKYEKAGVKEYWIVEPDGKFISVFSLEEDGRYGRPETYTDEDFVTVSIFNDLKIDLKSVFNLF